MTDLRIGLVEALAAGLVAHAADRDLLVLLSGNVAHRLAEGALDYGLGFLTDNAEAWAETVGDLDFDPMGGNSLFPYKVTPEATAEMIAFLIAALSDSRDTGEKP